MTSAESNPEPVDTAEIHRRLDVYASTADVNDLWPDVDRRLRNAGHRQIFAAARAVLSNQPGHRHLSAPDARARRALGIAGYISGMGPLLGHWIETGTLEADPEVAALFATHLEHGRRRAQQMTRRCTEVLEALNRRNVTPTLMKGIHTAHQYFPEPGVRPMADVDLLVVPADLATVEGTLESKGFAKTAASRGQASWSHRDAPKGIRSIEINHAANPWNIDLHTSIDRSFPGGFWARMGELPFHAVEEWELDGFPAKVFAEPLRLVHLAVHTASNIHQVQLVRLVELALVIRDDTASGALRWPDVTDLITERDLARFVYPVLELTEGLVSGLLPRGFRADGLSRATRRVTRVINHRIDSGMSIGEPRSMEEQLIWARGPRELLRATTHVLRARDAKGWVHTFRRRLRLMLRRRVSWKAGP